MAAVAPALPGPGILNYENLPENTNLPVTFNINVSIRITPPPVAENANHVVFPADTAFLPCRSYKIFRDNRANPVDNNPE